MQLKKILLNCDCTIVGTKNKKIEKLCFDSKKTTKNSLFFCILGTKVNGEQYIFEAINNGAVAVVLQKSAVLHAKNVWADKIQNILPNVTYIFVEDVRKTMAIMSANFYNNPQKKLKMIGITGTNGKTSTSYIIAQMLQKFKKKVGVIGTSGIFVGEKKYPANLTTPDSPELFEILAKMVKCKVKYCVMEVSAHAIFFDKTFGINWTVKVLTNVKSDHLDFFKTLKKYQEAKQLFFQTGNCFVVNGDDKVGKIIAQNHADITTTYGYEKQNSFSISSPKFSFGGSNFDVKFKNNLYHFATNLVGKFNLYNFLASIAVLQKLGFSIKKLQKKPQNYQILGRFSAFKLKNNCNVIVDYAHTTDSLFNLLKTIKQISGNKNIIVFGCPGERESKKRFDMGFVAGKFCETIIVTTDNPASENPRRIAFEILCGAKKTDAKMFFVEDRKKAIKKAFQNAKKDSNILIVGKGSEEYQIVGDKKVPYSDFDEVKKYL